MSLDLATKRVSDVLTHVKRQFGDESGAQITDDDIIRWLNDGLREAASTGRLIEGKSTTNLVAGTYDYPLPTESAFEIVTIRVKGVPIPGLSFPDFESNFTASDPQRTQSGTPQMWTKWGSTISLWPTPDTSIAGGLTVFYIGIPAPVAVSTDFLTLPDDYYEAIIAYVMSKAYELDEDYATSGQARDMFKQRLSESYDKGDSGQSLTYPTITITDWD